MEDDEDNDEAGSDGGGSDVLFTSGIARGEERSAEEDDAAMRAGVVDSTAPGRRWTSLAFGSHRGSSLSLCVLSLSSDASREALFFLDVEADAAVARRRRRVEGEDRVFFFALEGGRGSKAGPDKRWGFSFFSWDAPPGRSGVRCTSCSNDAARSSVVSLLLDEPWLERGAGKEGVSRGAFFSITAEEAIDDGENVEDKREAVEQ